MFTNKTDKRCIVYKTNAQRFKKGFCNHKMR